MSVSSTKDLAKLDAILYTRPAGRNIIDFAVDEIKALRARVHSMNAEFPFRRIAFRDGVLFTKWGPCFCPSGKQGECAACRHADALEAAGLDYETEWRSFKARIDARENERD